MAGALEDPRAAFDLAQISKAGTYRYIFGTKLFGTKLFGTLPVHWKKAVYWEHFGIFQGHQKRYILSAQRTTTPEHLENFAVAA